MARRAARRRRRCEADSRSAPILPAPGPSPPLNCNRVRCSDNALSGLAIFRSNQVVRPLVSGSSPPIDSFHRLAAAVYGLRCAVIAPSATSHFQDKSSLDTSTIKSRIPFPSERNDGSAPVVRKFPLYSGSFSGTGRNERPGNISTPTCSTLFAKAIVSPSFTREKHAAPEDVIADVRFFRFAQGDGAIARGVKNRRFAQFGGCAGRIDGLPVEMCLGVVPQVIDEIGDIARTVVPACVEAKFLDRHRRPAAREKEQGVCRFHFRVAADRSMRGPAAIVELGSTQKIRAIVEPSMRAESRQAARLTDAFVAEQRVWNVRAAASLQFTECVHRIVAAFIQRRVAARVVVGGEIVGEPLQRAVKRPIGRMMKQIDRIRRV